MIATLKKKGKALKKNFLATVDRLRQAGSTFAGHMMPHYKDVSLRPPGHSREAGV